MDILSTNTNIVIDETRTLVTRITRSKLASRDGRPGISPKIMMGKSTPVVSPHDQGGG